MKSKTETQKSNLPPKKVSDLRPKTNLAFTLIEVLIVVGILIILIVLTIPFLSSFKRESDLVNSTERIVNNLRLAQNKALASEGASQWGVYFSTSTIPQQYILFKGSDYLSRDSSFDEVQELLEITEIYDVDLVGQSEVVFNRIDGEASQSGSISLRLKTDLSKTRTIYIEDSGRVSLASSSAPSDIDRTKDSRHVHIDYTGRNIATSSEKLILTFSNSPNPDTIQEIAIADNLRSSQIYWSSSIDVDGEIQRIKIHTHRLNDPGQITQFSIHRDQRYNNKALEVEISGDATGNLIQYTAVGQTATGTSIYVTGPDWQ